jgi:hypothetical protein
MPQFLLTARDALASVHQDLPWAAITLGVFLAVYLTRKLAPATWERFAAAVPVLAIDPSPVLVALSKLWQALPAVLLGAALPALASGGNVKQALVGAAMGALAPVLHELAKAAPWLPYRGATPEPKKPPTLPPGGAGGVAALALAVALTLGIGACSPSQWEAQAQAADAVARASNDTVYPALLNAYELASVAAIAGATDRDDGMAKLKAVQAAWSPVWDCWDAYRAAHGAWVDAIATRGDPIAAALAARGTLCKLRLAAAKVGATLPAIPGVSCS